MAFGFRIRVSPTMRYIFTTSLQKHLNLNISSVNLL